MSRDIVDRLRAEAGERRPFLNAPYVMMIDAADTIEQLRGERERVVAIIEAKLAAIDRADVTLISLRELGQAAAYRELLDELGEQHG